MGSVLNHEKYRKESTESLSHNHFRWRLVLLHCAQPTVEMLPNHFTKGDCKVLKDSLCDTAKLYVVVVGTHLSFDLLSVFFSFHMHVLVAASSPDRGHCFHPEMVPICAERVKCLLEANFYLESVSIDLKDVKGLKRGLSSHENHFSPRGVFNENKPNQLSNGPPQQI